MDGFLLAAFKFAGCVLLTAFVLGVAVVVCAKTVALGWRTYLDARKLREAFGFYMANKSVCDTVLANMPPPDAPAVDQVIA